MSAFGCITKGAGQIADIRNGNADDPGALVSILAGNPNFVSEDMQSRYSVVEMKSATLLPQLHPVIPVILISVGYFRSMSLIIPPISVDRIPETVTLCSSLSTSQGLSIPISKLAAVGPRRVTAGSRFSQACRKALTSGQRRSHCACTKSSTTSS